MRRVFAILFALAASVVAVAGAAPPVGTTTIFAHIGDPGMPEGIAVHDGVVYVSTHTSIRGNAGGPPSKIFRYDVSDGTPLGEITIEGQNLAVNHGVLAMGFDAADRLYVVDRNPGRIIRIDGAVQSTYATVPDLPACRPVVGPADACSPTALDSAPFADYLAFAPDGSMFVSEFESATIFRVPPGGGAAQIWYQDARFDGIFGVNGIAVDPTGSKIYFAQTGSQQPGTPAQGIIWTLPIVAQPTAADLEVFYTYLEPADGPDGIAFGASGRLYVALAGMSQVSILEPDGTEFLRFPDAVSNQMQEVPYDLPASVAFDGSGSLLVTNQSFFAADPSHWVVFRAWVDDTALPLQEPTIG
jgi:sugar lactone lactonase YvrE